ncbi:MAG: hypothetical protein J5974_02690 [Pyramidobacter sp.]|nr:hypothetical protein [Pyramidobacter sp.]
MSRGLWVKVSVDLPRHAKLYRLARRLNITRRDAFYYVFNLWRFAMLNYPDGNLPADDEELAYGCDLDESIDPAQFAYELVHCGESRPGFLDEHQNGYHVHDWEQYSGENNDKREYYREYRRAERARKKAELAQQTAIEHVQSVQLNCSVERSAEIHPLEPDPEPEPEIQNHCPPFKSGSEIDDGAQKIEAPEKSTSRVSRLTEKELKEEFEVVWENYPRKRSSAKDKALKSYIGHRRKGVPMEDFKKAVEGYADYIRDNCIQPQYVMMGSTFFGPSGRWKDFIGDDDEPRLAFGGMMEPENNEHFENENDLIQKEFGGDMNAYAKWLAAGSPQPAGEWYRRFRS